MNAMPATESKLEVLVVDDDRTNRELSASMMIRMGMKTDTAASGDEAVALCNTKQYDIVFMDIEMPEMDGHQTTQAIRALQGGASKAHIVALTASLSNKDQVLQCIQSGMNDCMAKPLKYDALKSRLAKWRTLKTE